MAECVTNCFMPQQNSHKQTIVFYDILIVCYCNLIWVNIVIALLLTERRVIIISKCKINSHRKTYYSLTHVAITFYISIHLINCDFKNGSLLIEFQIRLLAWYDLYRSRSMRAHSIASIPKKFSSVCLADNQFLIEKSESLIGIIRVTYIIWNFVKLIILSQSDMRSLYTLWYIIRWQLDSIYTLLSRFVMHSQGATGKVNMLQHSNCL